jgi:hypothetical protein
MDPVLARAKLEACLKEQHADGREFNRACLRAYRHLAAGKRLIHLGHSIRAAGLDDRNRPRVAIAAADRPEVEFTWPGDRRTGVFRTKRQWSRGRWSPRMERGIDMGQSNTFRPYGRDGVIRGYHDMRVYALVPRVPADVRPNTGQLRDWFILWEVDEWFDRPQRMTAPRDPLLLEHVDGELYAVLAEWDLTDVERAIMEQLRNEVFPGD